MQRASAALPSRSRRAARRPRSARRRPGRGRGATGPSSVSSSCQPLRCRAPCRAPSSCSSLTRSGQHLAALEADADALRCVGHQWPSAGCDDLGQHAAGRARVQERDARAADAGARLLVDQRACRPRLSARERRVDVGHLVGDVVQARALLGEELAHGRVRAERREQLDVVLADVEQHRLDALLGDDLAVGELEPEARRGRARAPARAPRRRRRCGRCG